MTSQPMDVLFLLDSLHGGGAETSVVEMLPALIERGVRPSITTLLPDDGALASRVAEMDLAVHRLDHLPWPNRFQELRRKLTHDPPDILHTSLMRADVLGRAAALRTRVAVVTSLVNCLYGPEHLGNSRYGAATVRAVHGLDALTARRVTVFHAISHQVAETMAARLRIDPEKMHVVYRGRDDGRLGRRTLERRHTARAALGLADDVPVVLVAGRHDKQKAVDVALAGFRMLKTSTPEAQLLVVGRPGNDADRVRTMARELEDVRLLGHRKDLPDLMCAADCLCFPSRWEGLGGTLVEALALELPVVATDIPPIREVLDGIDWPLVPVDDPAAVASALSDVLARRVPIEAPAAAGRRRFEQTFTLEAISDGMLALYQSALREADA